ncbi:chorismate mutase [Burkholderia sp. FERM BP-3421]|jgi:chorismate mutase|uniref:chorismate mutase n=1 Tax=Burkholderia sp. FERM BP-3421 TaxID=1494466 RepID=UPI0023621AA8|nr:chorismate mutase [Burkholderia sp. FERM BP-3421]WDD95457.1 chorismate mutase [Burkholderia sp. FERM BP-3421]
MSIPEQLADIRRQIDGIDDQIVPLLAKRIALALEASKHKHTVEEIRGCDRVQQVLDAAAARARRADGNADAIVAIYRAIIDTLTALQLREKGLTNS